MKEHEKNNSVSVVDAEVVNEEICKTGCSDSVNIPTSESDKNTDKPKRHGSDNLITLAERTKEEQRLITQKGGIASGEARRKKKHLREVVQAMLSHAMTDEQISEVLGTAENLLDGDKSVSAVLTARLIQEAAQGNVKAYETLRDTGGYKPREEVAVESITDADRALLAKIDRRQSG